MSLPCIAVLGEMLSFIFGCMARVSIWQVLYGALQKGCLKHKFRQTLVIEHDKDLQTTQSHRASVYSMQFEIAWEARMLLSTKQKQPCLPSNVCCFVESNWFGMELYTRCLVQKHWMVTVIAQQQAVSLSLQSILKSLYCLSYGCFTS